MMSQQDFLYWKPILEEKGLELSIDDEMVPCSSGSIPAKLVASWGP